DLVCPDAAHRHNRSGAQSRLATSALSIGTAVVLALRKRSPPFDCGPDHVRRAGFRTARWQCRGVDVCGVHFLESTPKVARSGRRRALPATSMASLERLRL